MWFAVKWDYSINSKIIGFFPFYNQGLSRIQSTLTIWQLGKNNFENQAALSSLW
jgi:hypothetical protein